MVGGLGRSERDAGEARYRERFTLKRAAGAGKRRTAFTTKLS